MTITAFDKPTLQALRTDLDAALAQVAAKHGIAIRVGTIRFDLAEFSATIKATIPEAKAAEAKAAEDMKWAKSFADMLGVDISEASTHPLRVGAKVVGYDANKRAKPWKFEWKGQLYVTNDEGIKAMFPKAAIEAPAL